jgi:predicted O-linked N-acetylglucosamine transferase (SPINDLY family)
LGLEILATHTDDDYVRMASALAADVEALTALRAELRPRMQRSPLMDGARFARHLENAYRAMWERWCGHEALRPAPALHA